MKIDPYYPRQKCKTMTLVSRNIRYVDILGVPRGGGVKQGLVGENKLFSSFIHPSRKRYEIRPKILLKVLMTNRKWHMRFRLAPSSVTLDDLELLQVYIF